MVNPTIIHWFRKGLRVHDNPALTHAIDLVQQNSSGSKNGAYLRPIFILDSEILEWIRVGANRWRFLQQALNQLDENLRKLNSRLYVVRGRPKDVFKHLFNEWHVSHITFELDIEPYAMQRDLLLAKQAKQHNVIVEQFTSHTIYDPNVIIRLNGGKAPQQYQRFLTIVNGLKGEPGPALPVPKSLLPRTKPPADSREQSDAHCYDCPTLKELKVDLLLLGPNLYPGGETEALARMQRSLVNAAWVCSFEKPKTSPNSLMPSTTVLSPYLKFGCLSARHFYHELSAVLQKNSRHTEPPVSLMGQLMWREFYYTAAASEPAFDRMVGNSMCRQIPWRTNMDLLDAWSHGRTGYPFIDAIMRQLRQEGWIHHLARHAVACFLTRGDLWCHWEDGQRVFEELLLDADWALNAGNWMWLSASAFFYQYFRVYSPVAFGKKTDKNGDYIRKYVPELSKYPLKFIYEPWKATAHEQRQFGCVLGKDYPDRIVVHEIVSKINMAKMAAAYKKHNTGTSGHSSDDDDDDKKDKKKGLFKKFKKEESAD